MVAVLAALGTNEERAAFLDALFTDNEREALLPERWKLLTMLANNDGLSQRGLARTAGVSQTTAARAHDAFSRHKAILTVIVNRIKLS